MLIGGRSPVVGINLQLDQGEVVGRVSRMAYTGQVIDDELIAYKRKELVVITAIEGMATSKYYCSECGTDKPITIGIFNIVTSLLKPNTTLPGRKGYVQFAYREGIAVNHGIDLNSGYCNIKFSDDLDIVDYECAVRSRHLLNTARLEDLRLNDKYYRPLLSWDLSEAVTFLPPDKETLMGPFPAFVLKAPSKGGVVSRVVLRGRESLLLRAGLRPYDSR
ncbi:hypothetical protein GCM10027567_13520 [Spongiibacter taiwanensis]